VYSIYLVIFEALTMCACKTVVIFHRVGLVESKIRILVGNLEKIPQIRLVRANPTMFPVDTEGYASESLLNTF